MQLNGLLIFKANNDKKDRVSGLFSCYGIYIDYEKSVSLNTQEGYEVWYN